MSFSHLFYGSVGVSSYQGATPLISLNADTGTITAQQICGNFNISANVNWNESDISPVFKSLYLSNADVNINSTADRLIIDLPNSSDRVAISWDGTIYRFNPNTLQANSLILDPVANGGVQCRYNTSAPNLQLYCPDNGGAVALYNSANTGYAWYVGTGGDAQFNNLTVRGALNAPDIPLYVNSNITIPNDANNYEVFINAGAQPVIITLAEDPTHQQRVNITLVNLGTAPNIAVGDGSPELSFAGNGLFSFLDLKAFGLGRYNLKYVNYGINGGDWWTFK
jgi:hypothetical protein